MLLNGWYLSRPVAIVCKGWNQITQKRRKCFYIQSMHMSLGHRLFFPGPKCDIMQNPCFLPPALRRLWKVDRWIRRCFGAMIVQLAIRRSRAWLCKAFCWQNRRDSEGDEESVKVTSDVRGVSRTQVGGTLSTTTGLDRHCLIWIYYCTFEYYSYRSKHFTKISLLYHAADCDLCPLLFSIVIRLVVRWNNVYKSSKYNTWHWKW